MTAAVETQEPPVSRPDLPVLPVLLGLTEMVDLFPHVAKQTVYRWRVSRGGSKPALPDPLVTVSGTPMCDVDTILTWAAGRKLDVDKAALRRIRKAQTGR